MDCVCWGVWESYLGTFVLFRQNRYGLTPYRVDVILQKLTEFLLVKIPDHVIGFVLQSRFTQTAFENLSPIDLFFDRVGRNQSVNDDVFFLADSVASIDALVVVGWVPVRIQNDGAISSSKSESNARNLGCQEKHKYTPILIESTANSVTFHDLGIAIKSHVSVISHGHDVLDHV